MNFSNFGIEDAAIVGGLLGFADEAIRDEQEDENGYDGDDAEIDIDPEQITDIDLRLFYNENPELFEFLVKKIIEFRKKAKIQRCIDRIQREISTEIKQMEEDEGSERCDQK